MVKVTAPKDVEIHIKNLLDRDLQYFIYNYQDTAKWLALNSGTIAAGDTDDEDLPANNETRATSKYFVRFVDEGELAGGSVKLDQTIELYEDEHGNYHTRTIV